MKKINSFTFCVLTVFVMSLACGCMQVDYVGQRYEAIEAADVKLYNDHSDVPPREYVAIGKATLIAPDGYSTDEMRKRLKTEAAEAGADAVEIVTAEREVMAEYAKPEDVGHGAMDTSNLLGNNSWEPDGSRNYTNSFGEAENHGEQQVTRYQMVVKAYFLRDAKKIKAQEEADAKAGVKPATASLTKITQTKENVAAEKTAGTVGISAGPSLKPATK